MAKTLPLITFLLGGGIAAAVLWFTDPWAPEIPVRPRPALPLARMRILLESPGGPIPARFVRDRRNPDREVAWLVNGEELIEVDAVDLGDGNGSLELRFPPFDSVLRAVRSDLEQDLFAATPDERPHALGTWTLRRGERTTEMPVRILRRDSLDRFAQPDSRPSKAVTPAAITGRWAVQFQRDENQSVGIFTVADQVPNTSKGLARIKGTFLTTLGDYRFLDGDFDGQQLRLSCFDGAHAFLFKATLQDDGSLQGDFWSRDTWHETWTAVRDPDAALPDPMQLTSWREDLQLTDFSFPSADPAEGRISLGRWQGQPTVLHVFGTWCPNCKDASRVMAQLHRDWRDQGLQVVGLAFEHQGTPAEQRARIAAYRQSSRVDYPILLVGPSDKGQASGAFPLLDRVRAYPTTVFLGRDGRARAVHTGFTGPAAPEEHQALVARFEELVAQLLR